MWHSPRRLEDPVRSYSVAELAALIEPVGLVTDSLEQARVADVVGEPILQRMEPGELVFALQETFRALLEDTPPPVCGPPGYQQAIIAELLAQTHGLIELELLESPTAPSDPARRAAWHSFTAFGCSRNEQGRRTHPTIEHLELLCDDPLAHRSPLLTAEIWWDMLLDPATGVVGEFLGDDDWRMDWLLDRPRNETKWVLNEAGIDLDTLHQLPPTPTEGDMRAAREYLRGLTAWHEADR
jgi:hypothetical protein